MFSFVRSSDAFTTIPTAMPTNTPPYTHHFPPSLSTAITFLLSFNALGDWLKLLLVGGVLETCRRLLFSTWGFVMKSFWITVEFEQEDASFDWIMVWLSQRPSWMKSREISISTRAYGLKSRAVLVPGEIEESGKIGRRVVYLPSLNSSSAMWYRRHYIRISRSKSQQGVYHGPAETLTLKILARDHRILDALLLEAKNTWNQAQERFVSIYASDANNRWRHLASRSKRPLCSIVLDDGIKELLLDDARDFMDSKSWYSHRGIPFRRGYLLYGVPGSGKTSMIHSLAGELGLNVYVISLSRVGLDDNGLQQLIADLPERCIALMEDIDAAFHQNLNRFLPEECEQRDPQYQEPLRLSSEIVQTSRVSLSGLLNALDGVGAQEGRLLFATTNRYSVLDAALCRPGRLDVHVEFKLASKYQARELFKYFYVPSRSAEDMNEEDDDDDESTDSGYGTPATSSTETDEKSADITEETPLLVGATHRVKAPKLSSRQEKVLAQQFADAIPHREFSMASLQGYLMSYKVRPFEAVAFVGKWVAEQRKKKSSSMDTP